MSWEENTAVQDEQANWAEFRAGRCVLEVICDHPGCVRTNIVIWEDGAVSAETSASVLQFWDVLRWGWALLSQPRLHQGNQHNVLRIVFRTLHNQ